MNARSLIVLCSFAAAIELAWFLPRPAATVYAQNGAPPVAGQGKQGKGGGFGRGNTPTFPGPPAGMQALPVDLFSSKNFYKDKDLWSDKRYFRCNTPRQITDSWTSGRIGKNPPHPRRGVTATSTIPAKKS